MSVAINVKRTKVFANTAARVAAKPDFAGQVGVQLDTGEFYRSTSLTVGAWSSVWLVDSLAISGTSGDGYISLLEQGSNPAAPASGILLYSAAASLGLRNSDGFIILLDTSSLTGTRTIDFPDSNGTFALTSDLTDYVEGPASATTTAIALFDGTTGKIIQNSAITVESGTAFALEMSDSGFATNEVTISVTASGKNVLALWNKHATGFSAITFRETAGEERFAIGYDNDDAVNYIESNNPDGADAPDIIFYFTDTGGSDLRMKLYENGRSAFFIVEDQANPALNIAQTTGIATFTYQSGFGVEARSLDAAGYSAFRVLDEGGGEAGVFGHFNADNNTFLRYYGTFQIIGDTNTTTLSATGAFGFPDGVRQTFNPNATNAGINVGSIAGDPSSPSNGDLWYDSTANELTARINGSNVALGAGGGSGTKTVAVFTPLDNQPPAAANATLDTRNSIALLAFDDGSAVANETAIFVGVMVEGANLASGLSVFVTCTAVATSGDYRLGAAWMRCNTDIDADSFDTAIEVTTTTNGTSGVPTKTTLTTTNIDGITAGDMYRLMIYRDTGDAGDTMTGDLQLLSVEVQTAA